MKMAGGGKALNAVKARDVDLRPLADRGRVRDPSQSIEPPNYFGGPFDFLFRLLRRDESHQPFSDEIRPSCL